jgi:hypothetical protein
MENAITFLLTHTIKLRPAMNDLETAKNQLVQEQLTLIIVKNGEILFATQSPRISGFLTAIEEIGRDLEGASIADKVVGKAVALLCVYAGIIAVFAETLSRNAIDVLEQRHVEVEWKRLVDNILDTSKKDVCPFEREATNIADPKEAYNKFKILQQKLRACK